MLIAGQFFIICWTVSQELNKEKMKAAAAIKSHQEKAEQKLHTELQRKVGMLAFAQ